MPEAGHLWSSFGTWWGDSLTRPRLDISGRRSVHDGRDSLTCLRLDISGHRLACGGEILLLAPGWTSLVVIWHMVGRFSYSPQAGHLWSSFGTWWGDSLTRPRLDISGRCLAHGGEALLLTPGWTSFVVVWCMVGRFSYSPQPDISGHHSVHGGEILLFVAGSIEIAI